ncbi:hypothetical protein ES703_100044 [subsurface metagenome]
MILSSRLVLKKQSDRIALVIPLGFRLLLLGIGFLILLLIVATTPGGVKDLFVRSNILPLILSAASILAAGYHECWIFDKKADSLVYQIGMIWLHTNRLMKLSDLKRVELVQFIKGSLIGQKNMKRHFFQKNIVTLSILDKNGSLHRLETYTSPRMHSIEDTARSIAEYCRIPFLNQLSQGSK